MHGRFGYCFMTPPGSEYPPILTEHRIEHGRPLTIDGQGGPIEALPVLQNHGDIPSLGFRFGKLAYSCDIKSLPEASLAAMTGLDLWIVDALRKAPHPSHMNLDEALVWIAKVKPKRTILTNLHSDLDYEALRASLPPNVEPAYDGMAHPNRLAAHSSASRIKEIFQMPRSNRSCAFIRPSEMFHNMSYANPR